MPIKTILTKQVQLTGLTPLMFDRYAGNNTEELLPEQKLYLRGNHVVLPSLNIISFLSAQNTESATKRVLDKREYKDVAAALLSSVSIDPLDVPILRDGKPVMFKGFNAEERDPEARIHIERHVARLPKGIPNPKIRPVLELPWEMKFALTVYPSEDLSETLIAKIFTEGGMQLGLGTYRGVYGKFQFSWS